MTKEELNALMIEVQKDNNDSFETLYKNTYKQVFSFIYSYIQNYETSEDLLQETYIKVKTKCGLYSKFNNVMSWILQIAKNTCLDYLRHEKNNQTVELNENITKSSNDDYISKFYVHDLLNKYLNDIDRQIVLLHLEFGYKDKEIAQILNIPLGTVLWKYNNAIKILQENIKEEYLQCH